MEFKELINERYSVRKLGYPAEDSQPLDMHYKNRDINEVVFYDKF